MSFICEMPTPIEILWESFSWSGDGFRVYIVQVLPPVCLKSGKKTVFIVCSLSTFSETAKPIELKFTILPILSRA